MGCLSDDVVGEITEVHWVSEEYTLLQTLYSYVLIVIQENSYITQCGHTKIKRSCMDLCFLLGEKISLRNSVRAIFDTGSTVNF